MSNLTRVVLEKIQPKRMAKYGEYAGYKYNVCIFRVIDDNYELNNERVFMNVFDRQIGNDSSPHNIIRQHLKPGTVFEGVLIVTYNLPNRKRKYHIHNFTGNITVKNYKQ